LVFQIAHVGILFHLLVLDILGIILSLAIGFGLVQYLLVFDEELHKRSGQVAMQGS
jgi:hypothetical protein